MQIAVVIPALDEAERILGTIASVLPRGPGHAVRSANAAADPGLEILVVDAGSQDATAELARRAGARVLAAGRGRARQLEAGWRASSAEAVVFLHADTRLEAGWEQSLREALDSPGVVGGAFRLRFDAPGLGFRAVEGIVRLRVWLFSLPYGDQAIFVRRSLLEKIGGVPAVSLMEDLDLVREMNRHGRVVALAPYALTSARRYRQQGVLGTLVRNAVALMAWRAGVNRERIARWVRR
ncbi:MAG: TIGR04283 family arsenosugar biosynthesis glycosyltransferase [Myxococcota bacterium]|nr:TIGR04283 family arsenosugar biosynthesis glycosyltransferase [Myxococcota bacterium]